MFSMMPKIPSMTRLAMEVTDWRRLEDPPPKEYAKASNSVPNLWKDGPWSGKLLADSSCVADKVWG